MGERHQECVLWRLGSSSEVGFRHLEQHQQQLAGVNSGFGHLEDSWLWIGEDGFA
jgi:hypothetical protein